MYYPARSDNLLWDYASSCFTHRHSYAILFLMVSRMVIDVAWATFKDGERYLAGHCAANKEVAFGSSLMAQALGSEG